MAAGKLRGSVGPAAGGGATGGGNQRAKREGAGMETTGGRCHERRRFRQERGEEMR